MNLTWHDTPEGVNWQDLSDLYHEAPLGAGRKPPERLQAAFEGSRFIWLVYEERRLVGAGRAVADGADFASICDVAVRPEVQGRGIGKALVARLMAQLKGHQKILLYAVPGKEGFYRPFGFRPMTTAMAVFQNPSLAFERGYLREC